MSTATETDADTFSVNRPDRGLRFVRLSSGLLAWARRRLPMLERNYVLVAAIMTFVPVTVGAWRPSLWEDELATWSAATRSWSQLWKLFSNLDAVAAPYYVFMHVWVSIFGASELSLRFPSILSITAAAALVAVLARRLTNVRVALLTSMLFALMPGVTRVGQEARVGAFAVMLTVLSTLVLLKALEQTFGERASRAWWAGYGVTVVLLGAANMIAALIVLVHAVFVVHRWRRLRDPSLLWWCGAVASALILLSPFIYASHSQAYQLSWVEKPSWQELPSIPDIIGSSQLGGAFVVLALLGLAMWREYRSLLAAWLAVPPAVLYLVSTVSSQSYWVDRYFYFLIPAFVILGALALSKLRLRHATWIAVVLAFLAVSPQIAVRSTSAHYAYNGPAVASYVEPQLKPGDVAVYADIDAHGPRDMVRYYGPSQSKLPDVLKVHDGAETGWYDATECANPAACLAGVSRIWMFRRDSFATDPFARMPDEGERRYLMTNFSVVKTRKIGAIAIVLLQRPTDR